MINKKLFKSLCFGLLGYTLTFSIGQANDALNIFNSLLQQTLESSKMPVRNNAQVFNQKVAREVVYKGYSKEFLPIKKLITSNQSLQAYQLQKQRVKKLDDIDFLNSNEAGLLALDTNNINNALKHFTTAEHFLKMNADKSFVEDYATVFGSEAFCVITGKCDVSEYKGEPFERILMLNYKSISYLLNGERKAYNVTRRAIDWQNIEQKEFQQNIKAAKQDLIEEETKVQQQTDNEVGSNNIFKIISQQYKSSEKTALSVSSAYVNPFGFYMAGIVQEFDSFIDSSLRDNARISYKKALKLNPKSKVLKKAVRDIKKRPRRGRRLVQVIIAEGFSPEKKTLQFGIPMPGGIVPVKLPIYEPVRSKIAHIRIKSGKTTLATLSSIANIEAIVLRHQLDSLPFEHFKVMASIARSTAENVIWGSLGALGQMGKSFREEFANPDMRSWMSLPKQFLAARFYVSKRLRNITIISYDKRWRRLATKKVALPKNKHSFVYARAIDNILNVNVNKTLWMNIK